MEILITGIVVVAVVLGIAWWKRDPIFAVLKRADDSLRNVADKVEDAVDSAEDHVEELEDKIEDVIMTLKSVPPLAELRRMSKNKLEELGREIGVELDRRKTKSNMISDLQAHDANRKQ